MAGELIKCPECGAEFELSQAISHDIEISVAKRYEKQLKELKEQSQKSIDLKEKELTEQFSQAKKNLEEKSRKQIEETQQQLEDERKRIEEQAKIKAQEIVNVEITDLKEQLSEKDKRLEENQKIELELRKRQRELETKERSLELEVTRQVDAEKRKIIDNVQKESEEKHHLKDIEKDKQLADMRKQIDELKRKAEQGSQQTQGEVLELELEEMLKNEFPFDEIEPVPKGIKGADAIQIVKTQSGKICGRILWETKRTKTWSDSWLQKLKYDQREAKADIAVLVSETLPKGLTDFRIINEVWVTSLFSALSLALALRVILTQVAREKQFQAGKQGKMEIVYNYLTGPEFRNRVEAIMEPFVTMKKDLDAEKRAMNKIWDKREKQIEQVIYNIGGMSGDLEGIAGMTLPKIKTLELPSLETEAKE